MRLLTAADAPDLEAFVRSGSERSRCLFTRHQFAEKRAPDGYLLIRHPPPSEGC